MEHCLNWYRVIVTLVCLVCFCVQVWDGFAKFVARQTTLVSTRKKLESTTLPTVSFCPGFKNAEVDYYDRSDFLASILDDFEDTRTPLEIWLNDTFDINEVITGIKPPGVEYHAIPNVFPNRTGYYPGANITIHEISTAYGRCYAIQFHFVVTSPAEYFSIRLNMAQHEYMLLYIHEEYNEIGQHYALFPITPTQVVIHRGNLYTIEVTRDTFEPYEKDDCNSNPDYSYPGCVVSWARQRFLDMFEENNRTACWIPDTQYYAIGSGTPPCQTKAEANWVRFHTLNEITNLIAYRELTGCARRCIRNDFKTRIVQEPEFNDGTNEGGKKLTAFFYQDTLTQEQFQEVVLYDANNIIALLGGSLGLFLGISGFSMLMFIGRRVAKRLKRQTPRRGFLFQKARISEVA